jgi:RNA-directed DNA polymerase
MAGLGFEMVRYADDMVVSCRNREEAGNALEKLREWMAEAGLTLHPENARMVNMGAADSHCDFLGYRSPPRDRATHQGAGIRPCLPCRW